MARWKEIPCPDCGGHGMVCDYGIGDDFYGANECNTCNGSGRLFLSPKGRLAKWPGGPFVGAIPLHELQQETTHEPQNPPRS